jgi:hypothetical protein
MQSLLAVSNKTRGGDSCMSLVHMRVHYCLQQARGCDDRGHVDTALLTASDAHCLPAKLQEFMAGGDLKGLVMTAMRMPFAPPYSTALNTLPANWLLLPTCRSSWLVVT